MSKTSSLTSRLSSVLSNAAYFIPICETLYRVISLSSLASGPFGDGEGDRVSVLKSTVEGSTSESYRTVSLPFSYTDMKFMQTFSPSFANVSDGSMFTRTIASGPRNLSNMIALCMSDVVGERLRNGYLKTQRRSAITERKCCSRIERTWKTRYF